MSVDSTELFVCPTCDFEQWLTRESFGLDVLKGGFMPDHFKLSLVVECRSCGKEFVVGYFRMIGCLPVLVEREEGPNAFLGRVAKDMGGSTMEREVSLREGAENRVLAAEAPREESRFSILEVARLFNVPPRLDETFRGICDAPGVGVDGRGV